MTAASSAVAGCEQAAAQLSRTPCDTLLCPSRMRTSSGDKSWLVIDTHLHAGVRAGAQQLCCFGRVVLLGRPQQQDVRRVQPRCKEFPKDLLTLTQSSVQVANMLHSSIR